MVNSQHIYSVAVPRRRPASAAVGRVPARHRLSASNKGEIPNVALLLPAVLPDKTVHAIRAGDRLEAAVGVVIADVVRDCGCRRRGGKSEDAEDLGEVHNGGISQVVPFEEEK